MVLQYRNKTNFILLDGFARVCTVSANFPDNRRILKQRSLATQNLVGIIFIIKTPVLKMDDKLIAQICLHVNYLIIGHA